MRRPPQDAIQREHREARWKAWQRRGQRSEDRFEILQRGSGAEPPLIQIAQQQGRPIGARSKRRQNCLGLFRAGTAQQAKMCRDDAKWAEIEFHIDDQGAPGFNARQPDLMNVSDERVAEKE